MRCYEVIFLMSPDITGEEVANKMKDFAGDLIKVGCDIVLHNADLVPQKLAYPIKKRDRGYFNVFHIKVASENVEKLLNLYTKYIDHNDLVLRSMIYKVKAHTEISMVRVATINKAAEIAGTPSAVYSETAGAVLINEELVAA